MTCLVRTEQVAYRYAGEQQGLHAISTEVEAGEALVGYIVFGALGGLLGALTLRALRRAGFFAYLAEKR